MDKQYNADRDYCLRSEIVNIVGLENMATPTAIINQLDKLNNSAKKGRQYKYYQRRNARGLTIDVQLCYRSLLPAVKQYLHNRSLANAST